SHDEIGDTCQAFEKMRLQLRAARDTRDKYDQNRKELLAGISHDLSTPLTKIEGYASGIRDGIANTPEKEAHYLDMIVDTSHHMASLVRTLFLFSKLDLGQVPFHWERVDVCAYIKDYISEQAGPFREQGLDITFQSPLDQAFIAMDRQQFQRVLENIIGNSLKYKDQAVGHLTLTLTDSGEGSYLLSFADDGCGVDDSELPKLFESFYRTDKARTNVAKGSGLGLAVVQQIVQAMKGQIWAQATVPKGLTICITLPKGESINETHLDY
ncbi:MAG: HAMP domain-containing histidine kinase, partial [Megasphaera elsdenii]|nr:HAMP domain-containing histidine kinase [Megasphaera elsdenii]